jgi:hypothetical protein
MIECKSVKLNAFEQRSFFDDVAESLNIKLCCDWLRVTKADIIKSNGKRILKQHHNSLYSALQVSYPDTRWNPWRFEKMEVRFWELLHNRIEYIDWLEEQLEIEVNRLYIHSSHFDLIDREKMTGIKYHHVKLKQ